MTPMPTAKDINQTHGPQSDDPSALEDADYSAMGAFRFALRKFLAFSESRALAAGVTAQQHQALLAIKAHPGPGPMTIGELAASLLIKNHSAVGLVARLVERGLVTRQASREDRRRIALSITPLADALVEAITRQNLEELNVTAPVFTDLLATLKRIGR
jgi:DNA-binding MarR family transcriptional regulator